MLKRILGQAPFEVYLEKDVVVVPRKKTLATLVFVNQSEYDLPLSCSLKIMTSVMADKCEFDVCLPAEGNTKDGIVFSLPEDAKIPGGKSVCELEIIDRILDSKTVYELEIMCEMSFKCCEKKEDAFSATDEVLYTRDGVFFANKGEIIALEIPKMQESEIELSVVSGKIKDFCDGQIIKLSKGLNRLCFEITEDTSFKFKDPVSCDTVFAETLNPKYFMIGEKI